MEWSRLDGSQPSAHLVSMQIPALFHQALTEYVAITGSGALVQLRVFTQRSLDFARDNLIAVVVIVFVLFLLFRRTNKSR